MLHPGRQALRQGKSCRVFKRYDRQPVIQGWRDGRDEACCIYELRGLLHLRCHDPRDPIAASPRIADDPTTCCSSGSGQCQYRRQCYGRAFAGQGHALSGSNADPSAAVAARAAAYQHKFQARSSGEFQQLAEGAEQTRMVTAITGEFALRHAVKGTGQGE